MIWNDTFIREWAENGGVEPSEGISVNPASLDLRWSGRYRAASRTLGGWSELYDVDVLELKPGGFYLLDTLEFVRMPPDAVGKLFLKSSAGRLGIEHLHAGYVDPDFCGTLTLEIEIRVPWTVAIKRNQRLVQLTLEQMVAAPAVSYSAVGRYNNQRVPTTSKGLPE